MMFKIAVEALLLVSSIYLLVVSMCISARMSWRTPHMTRIAIVCMGGLSFWSLAKVISGEWQFCFNDMVHTTLVAMSVVTMLLMPRVDV